MMLGLPDVTDEDAYYSERQARLRASEYDWERLKEVTVLIVGVGAVGGEVLKHLGHLAVGRVIVLDAGKVSRTNFSRSVVFSTLGPAAEGRSKVEVAEAAMRLWSPRVEMTPLHRRVEETGLGPFLEADLVFNCVDTIAARIHVQIQAARASVPVVEGGMVPGDLARLQVSAADSMAGPCGSICRSATMQRMARDEILPAAYYAHFGCTAERVVTQELTGVPSLSMTASVVAAQMSVLGLRLTRSRAAGVEEKYGSVIDMALRASGEQLFRQEEWDRCSDCIIDKARAHGVQAQKARSLPVRHMDGTLETKTLDDVLREGAAALNVPETHALVWVDEGFTTSYRCNACNQEGTAARLGRRLREHGCARNGMLYSERANDVIYSRSLPAAVVERVKATPLAEVGFRPCSGWIVAERANDGTSSARAVRVVVGR